MRVVVDTNVLVSAVLKDASTPAIAMRLVERQALLLKSAATESELFELLTRPYFARLINPHSRAWLTYLLAKAEPIAITEAVTACRDPADDRFLELAVNGRASLIISGDADLLVLDPFRSIPIITPATFVKTTSD